MRRPQRISAIEREYPDQWVVVEVTRIDRGHRAVAGRLLAHSADEDEITRETIRVREEQPEADLWTFYTGDLIPKGMIVIFARL